MGRTDKHKYLSSILKEEQATGMKNSSPLFLFIKIESLLAWAALWLSLIHIWSMENLKCWAMLFRNFRWFSSVTARNCLLHCSLDHSTILRKSSTSLDNHWGWFSMIFLMSSTVRCKNSGSLLEFSMCRRHFSDRISNLWRLAYQIRQISRVNISAE